MPQAEQRLRDKFSDESAAEQLIVTNYTCRFGIISPRVKGIPMTQEEKDAIDYLVQEWDYAYEPDPDPTAPTSGDNKAQAVPPRQLPPRHVTRIPPLQKSFHETMTTITLAPSPTEIDHLVAESIGWKRCDPQPVEYMWRPGSFVIGQATWISPEGKPMMEEWIPKFSLSNDVMGPVLDTLSIEDREVFLFDVLPKIIAEDYPLNTPEEELGWRWYNATAPQRSRGYLTLKKLWPETKLS